MYTFTDEEIAGLVAMVTRVTTERLEGPGTVTLTLREVAVLRAALVYYTHEVMHLARSESKEDGVIAREYRKRAEFATALRERLEVTRSALLDAAATTTTTKGA